MKRKIIACLTICMVLALGVVGLSACKNKKKKQPQHSHAYTQMVANQANLKTAATCEAPALYYKSCSCGKKGTEAFESGEPLGHEYGTANYAWEENMCTATRTCIHDASHFETETVEGTYVYPSFDGLVYDFSPSALGFSRKDPEYIKEYMTRIYDKENVRKYGAVAIKIKRIK